MVPFVSFVKRILTHFFLTTPISGKSLILFGISDCRLSSSKETEFVCKNLCVKHVMWKINYDDDKQRVATEILNSLF